MANTDEQSPTLFAGAPSLSWIYLPLLNWLHQNLFFLVYNGFLIFACLATALSCLLCYIKYLKQDGPLDRRDFDQLIARIKPHLRFMVFSIQFRLFWPYLVFFLFLAQINLFSAILSIMALGFGAWYLLTLQPWTRKLGEKVLMTLAILYRPRSEYGIETEKYEYSKLGKDQIRLLTLHPRLLFMPVRVSMMTVDLKSATSYEAISYTWGSPVMSHQILINKLPFYTTRSAFNILRGRSSVWRTRNLWIDSICINQGDNDEKTKQVGLMREIYTRCSRCVVWLGNSGGMLTSLLSVSLLYDLASSSLSPLSCQIHEKEPDLATIFNVIRFEHLIRFLNSPWFERVWIIQEVALPRVVHVVHNGQYLDWEVLTEAFKSFKGPQGLELTEMLRKIPGGRRALIFINNIAPISAIRQLSFVNETLYRHPERFLERETQITGPEMLGTFEGCLTGVKQQLSEIIDDRGFIQMQQEIFGEKGCKILPLGLLLKTFTFFKSTIDVDKVYSLIGLSTDDSGETFTPTYPGRPRSLFTEVARYVLSTQDPFCVLHCAGIGHERKYEDLPSWAPDWTMPPYALLSPYVFDLNVTNPRYHRDIYKASGDSKPQVNVYPDREAIQVRAIYADKIVAVGAVRRLRDKDEKPIRYSSNQVTYSKGNKDDLNWHSEAWKLAQRAHPPLQTRRDLKEAFWRTLASDIEHITRPASPEVERLYDSWVETITRVDEMAEGMGRPLTDDEEESFRKKLEESYRWGPLIGQGSVGRRLCVTKNGYLGLVPPGAKRGDEMWVLLGATIPYVLRGNSETSVGQSTYRLVGECYVDEMMDGEIFEIGGEQVDVTLE